MVTTGVATPVPPAQGHRRVWIAGGVAALLLAIAGGVWWWTHRLPPIDSVAIAPFTGSQTPGWLAFGISTEVTETLAAAEKVRVTPDAGAVLTGSVEQADDKITVSAELTRASDHHRYWRKQFRRPLKEAALLPSDIAGAIARIPKRKAHQPNFEAWRVYLEGRGDYRPGDAEALGRAIQQFDHATQADPEFASAWAWLAIAREALDETHKVRPNEIMPGARDAAERAVTADGGSAIAHAALGIIRLQYDWDWDTAKAELDRAKTLAPGSPLPSEWLARYDTIMGRGAAPPAAVAPPAGDPAALRKTLEDAEDIRADFYDAASNFVRTALAAGDRDALFKWLDKAYDERDPELPYLLRGQAIPKDDPRYAELCAKLKLP